MTDFLRYLETEHIELGGLAKCDAKTIYETDYKRYRSQISPDEKIPNFFIITETLINAKQVHLRNNVFYPGSQGNGYSQKPQKSGQNTQAATLTKKSASLSAPSNEQDLSHNVDKTKSKRRRNRQSRNHSKTSSSYSSLVDMNKSTNISGTMSRVERPNSRMEGDVSMKSKEVLERLSSATVMDGQTTKPKLHRKKLAVDQHISYNKPDVCQKEENGESTGLNFLKKRGFYCSVCSTNCTSKGDFNSHMNGRLHRTAVIMQGLKKRREELLADKHGVTITTTQNTSKGTVFMDIKEGVPMACQMVIKNNSQTETYELLHCEMLKRLRVFQLDDPDKVTESRGTKKIHPGTKYSITVTALARHVGTYHIPLAFQFATLENRQHQFHIIRFIQAECQIEAINQLKPSKVYKHPQRSALKWEATEMVEGLKLPAITDDHMERTIKLGPFTVPDTTRYLINRGLKENPKLTQAAKLELTTLRSVIEKPLEMSDYDRRFSALMHFEEIQTEVDIRKYDMENVTMKLNPKDGRLLLLPVPGLAERRPSVLRGDWLIVRICSSKGNQDKEYQGYVHSVHEKEVALGFNDRLMKKFIPEMKFNVRFVFNRLPLRLQHRSCQLAKEESLENVLFPTSETASTMGTIQPLEDRLVLHNQHLEKNEEQYSAIRHIVAGTSRPAPYLIFGPPGTGKTVTIVEAIKQIWKCQPKSHILACTPSNSAADLITKRLLYPAFIPKSQVLRLHAMSRPWSTVPVEIKDVGNYDTRKSTYFYPKIAELMKYRIIVCTLVTGGRIASASFPAGHFTHIFIDEAGHATEPETLISVAGILDCNPDIKDGGQLVLAGDPQQLGPILRSPFAIKYGLDVSLLERLMTQCPIYQRHHSGTQKDILSMSNILGRSEGPKIQDKFWSSQKHYDSKVITKLLNNYRSHPAILNLPTSMFYDNELWPMADKLVRESLCKWEGLPSKGFPMVFHSVIGKDAREEKSPSFFNPEEAVIVDRYIVQLLEARGGVKIKPSDIGVISPYRKQVQKIQGLVRKRNLQEVQVGSVEEFQGQERMVIIVSTVRSSPQYLSLDMKFKLGFLRNPKRFNVTVTRAKALLIVIGNPNTLYMDAHWKQYIDFCRENGGFTGTEFDTDDMLEDVIQRLATLNLTGAVSESDMESPEVVSLYNDQPWKSDH